MNVSEYTPLYGLLFNFEYQTGIDGKKMTVNEMFENYPEHELSDYQIEQLDFFDLASLQKALSDKYFTPDNVIPYLRGLFDNYRENGGNPFDWLGATFQSVNLNPQNYRKDLITYIEKALIEWIEIFEKQPIDYLFFNSNIEPKLKEDLPDFLEILKEAEEDEKNANKEEKTIFFVEYQKTPLELFNEVNELSNWIIEREYCNWCTIVGCIDADFDFINKLFRIVLSENILNPLSEINKIENQRNELINFINILQSSINSMDESKHDFFRYFKKYCQSFVNKVERRFNFELNYKPQQQIQENRIESQIEPFNPEIFIDQFSYDLFLFLVDEYATSKRPKQFSQLFHWMQRQNFIKPTTGKKYQKFVRERFPEMVAKFSRIDVRNRDEITTLNELGKKFNSLNKV
jgi:hypothetical protein